MKHIVSKSIIIISIISLFIGCGEDGFIDTTPSINDLSGDGPLTISGTISYERVQAQHSGTFTRLNYNNLTHETAKEVLIKAIDSRGRTIASTSTDSEGKYTLEGIPESAFLKIRVYAQMIKDSTWDVKVIDNTNNSAQYILEGSLANTGTSSTIRDLSASASDDSAAPFAILDSIHQAMLKVQTGDNNINFPALKINWSVNNVSSGTFSPSRGLLYTTFYQDKNIYVLGKKDVDADEFDNHVIIHEWGHYFEDVFSKMDSIGGGHSSGNHLDIRVAFGEGWGNAFSAMATDDPVYFDTSRNGASGWNMNIEAATKDTPGFFSEASIQRVLYDLYDNNDDGTDTLSLGFKPLYDVFVGAQKTTPAFTSIFSFITALKNENSSSATKIDAILANEEINTITDIYGSTLVDNNLNSDVLPLYTTITVGNSINTCTNNTYGVVNKLANNKYLRLTVTSTANYAINVSQTNGISAVPNFTLYKAGNRETLLNSENTAQTRVSRNIRLSTGDYLVNVTDKRGSSRACFDIAIN